MAAVHGAPAGVGENGYLVDGCDTLPKLFLHRCRTLGERTAHREKHLGIWQSHSWAAFLDAARAIGLGLAALGLKRGEVVAILSEDRKEIKEFSEAGGAILIRKPGFIRVKAEFPVVGSTVFDMTSDGTEFKVHLPTQERFLVGRNELTKPSEKRSENVRPQHIREALVIDPPLEGEEIAFLRNVTYSGQAYHVVSIRKTDRPQLAREIWFDRVSLHIARQAIYEAGGELATDAWYRQWLDTETVPFPGVIQIDRPKDGYLLRVEVLKPGVNEQVPPKAFVLNPPEGVTVERIGDSSEEEPRAGGQ